MSASADPFGTIVLLLLSVRAFGRTAGERHGRIEDRQARWSADAFASSVRRIPAGGELVEEPAGPRAPARFERFHRPHLSAGGPASLTAFLLGLVWVVGLWSALADVAGLLLGHFPDAGHAVLIPARQQISRRSERERHHRVAVFFLQCLLEVADPPVVLTVGRPRLPHIDRA